MFTKNHQKVSTFYIVLFLIISVVLISAGVIFYLVLSSKTLEAKKQELTSIQKIKTNQIVHWRMERISEARFFFNNDIFLNEVSVYLNNPDKKNDDLLTKWLSTVQRNHYSTVIISDLQSNEFFRLGLGGISLNESKLDSTINLKTYWMNDLTEETGTGFIHLDLYVPLIKNNEVFAVMILIINPEKDLYPIVRSWPFESATGEALIVRKEGDKVVALNEFRFRNNTALEYKMPEDLIGEGNFFRRKDYRGEKVLASTGKIPGTEWYLVTKVDQAEVFEVVNMISVFIGTIIIALLLASGIGIAFYARRKEYLSFQKLYKIEQEKLALKEHYELLIKFANDIILLMDYNGSIIDVNDKTVELYGYDRDEMLAKNISDLRLPDVRDNPKSLTNDSKKDGLLYESAHLKKNGEIMYVEVSSRVIEIGARKFIQNIIRDITDRRISEQKVERLSRVYALLSQINDVIIRESDKQKLFKKICDVSVETGKFIAVGIGLIGKNSSDFNVIAAGGLSEEYFKNLNISLDDDLRGSGPTGSAIKEERYFIVNDIGNSPLMLPWREDALKRGYRSIGSFPIKEQDKTVGAIMFYSGEKGFFDDDEVRLLLNVSKNISFAIESLDKEKKRRQAEEDLRTAQFNLKILATNIPDTNVYLFDSSLNPLIAEGKELERFELEAGDFLSEKIIELFPSMKRVREELINVFENKSFEEEIQLNNQVFSIQLYPVKNITGEVYAGIAVIQNMTKRKEYETALIRSESWLKGFFNLNNVYMAILELRNNEDICFIMANAKLAEFYDCSMDELKSKCLRTLAGEEVNNYWIDIYRNINKFKRAVSVEFSMEKDNSIIWLVAEISPIEQIESKNPLFSYTAFDITERKNIENVLRKSEERFRSFFESGLTGIAYGDVDGNIHYSNNAYLEIIGYSREELEKGTINWMQLTPPDYLESDKLSLQKARNDGIYEPFEKELIRKDGKRVKVHITYFLSGESKDEITAFVTPI